MEVEMIGRRLLTARRQVPVDQQVIADLETKMSELLRDDATHMAPPHQIWYYFKDVIIYDTWNGRNFTRHRVTSGNPPNRLEFVALI